jgi:peptide/nickel transport system permease protein
LQATVSPVAVGRSAQRLPRLLHPPVHAHGCRAAPAAAAARAQVPPACGWLAVLAGALWAVVPGWFAAIDPVVGLAGQQLLAPGRPLAGHGCAGA